MAAPSRSGASSLVGSSSFMRGLLSRNPRARLPASAAGAYEWAGEAATGVRSPGSTVSRGWYATTSGRAHSIETAAARAHLAAI
eukprot:scaffold1159_cov68-Phaeocystis_antarctica.AAC.9